MQVMSGDQVELGFWGVRPPASAVSSRRPRRPNSLPGVNEKIGSDCLKSPGIKPCRLGDLVESLPPDRSRCLCSTDQAGCQENVRLVDFASVKKRAKECGAALNQNVRHSATPELLQQLIDCRLPGSGG